MASPGNQHCANCISTLSSHFQHCRADSADSATQQTDLNVAGKVFVKSSYGRQRLHTRFEAGVHVIA